MDVITGARVEDPLNRIWLLSSCAVVCSAPAEAPFASLVSFYPQPAAMETAIAPIKSAEIIFFFMYCILLINSVADVNSYVSKTANCYYRCFT